MDEDLARLLTAPFAQETTGRESQISTGPRSITIPGGDKSQQYGIFLNPPDISLALHKETIEHIRTALLDPALPAQTQQAVRQHAPELREMTDHLLRLFRTYIETADDDALEKEAKRLERRFFEKPNDEGQIEFIKLKRYYEKLRTFNASALDIWKSIQRALDTLSVITETRDQALKSHRDSIESVHALIRKTDSFLNALKNYLGVTNEKKDVITGVFQISLTFQPDVYYTIGGFFEGRKRESIRREAHEEPSEGDRIGEKGFSIARNIILETHENKLNRSMFYRSNLIGSRDWNRTPHYVLEVSVIDYEKCMKLFRESYHVNLEQGETAGKLNYSAAILKKNTGEKLIAKYVNLVMQTLENIALNIMNNDFPGLDNPQIFLYHCGPKVFYSILVATFQSANIGEMFYITRDKNIEREYPEAMLKREVIEWWNRVFEKLTVEDVDSFIAYSRCVEMVNKDYRSLYDESLVIRKKETGQGLIGFEKWLHENQKKIFGLRKIEIFKRFLKDRWFESVSKIELI
jgi:hypothetical protein